MKLFSADATMFSKRFFFLPTKSWKNLPQKLLIIGPNLLFHSPAQPIANSPKSIFHIIKMSHQASVLLSVALLVQPSKTTQRIFFLFYIKIFIYFLKYENIVRSILVFWSFRSRPKQCAVNPSIWRKMEFYRKQRWHKFFFQYIIHNRHMQLLTVT